MVADGKGIVGEKTCRVSIHDLGRLGFGRLGRMIQGPWRAFFAIRRIKPDVVHFHDPELLLVGMLLRMAGYIVIYDVHEDVPRQILSKHWLPWIIRRPVAWVISIVEWLSAKAFSAIVPATPQIAHRFPATKTVMIQNFPIANEMQLTDPIPYAHRTQSFVYPGAIAETRGIVEIIRAFELLGDMPGVRLDLAGTFVPASFIDKLRVLPGWKVVYYHGEVSRTQLAKLLGTARAGLVVHHPIPNEIHAQPIKLFEYMAVGLPVIASDFAPLRRIISEEGCGLIVDQSKPQAIADAMRWILKHPVEAELMGQRGRRAVERTYNWDVEATKLVKLYNKVLVG